MAMLSLYSNATRLLIEAFYHFFYANAVHTVLRCALFGYCSQQLDRKNAIFHGLLSTEKWPIVVKMMGNLLCRLEAAYARPCHSSHPRLFVEPYHRYAGSLSVGQGSIVTFSDMATEVLHNCDQLR